MEGTNIIMAYFGKLQENFPGRTEQNSKKCHIGGLN
jgi:hypothetical protein